MRSWPISSRALSSCGIARRIFQRDGFCWFSTWGSLFCSLCLTLFPAEDKTSFLGGKPPSPTPQQNPQQDCLDLRSNRYNMIHNDCKDFGICKMHELVAFTRSEDSRRWFNVLIHGGVQPRNVLDIRYCAVRRGVCISLHS